MRKMWLLLNQYVYHYRKFGKRGLKVCRDINTGTAAFIEVSLKDIAHPFYLRRNTSDTSTFYQVFSLEHYKIEFHNKPKYILDLGANIGLASIYFKKLFPDATIIALEPDVSNFKMLLKNTQRYSGIHCIQCGIWNKNVRLEVMNIGKGDWAYMTKEAEHAHDGSVSGITVDELMTKFDIPYIDILKMDIEGAEKEIFEIGYSRWMPKVRTLIVELHDRYKEGCSKAFFKAMGEYEFSSRIRAENIICDFEIEE